MTRLHPAIMSVPERCDKRPHGPPIERSRIGTGCVRGRHPPRFSFDQQFFDWPECALELACCKGVTLMSLRRLFLKQGDCTFTDLLRKLHCGKCGNHPAVVYLCASHFRQGNSLSATADWAIELVSPPKKT
jgi:hypothetical protein